MKTTESERHDWILILVILAIGFLCVILAGGWALRFPPRWELNANMESELDPNSGFLTGRPNGFVEAVDSSVLTEPSWLGVFLTPGASFQTRTPFPTVTATIPAQPTSVPPMNTPTATATATNMPVYFLPTSTVMPRPIFTNTSGPEARATFTSAATSTLTNILPLTTDLQITKDDGTSTYTANGALTYSVSILNNGPRSVIGAVVTDAIPAQIATWGWLCTSQTGGAAGCDGMNGNTGFSDTVDLPVNAAIVYTVTASVSGTATGNLVNTASINLPAGYIDSVMTNNTASDTDSPAVDLQLSNTDGTTTYTPGSTLTYTVIVTNNSIFNVNGITVTDDLSAQIVGATWSCAPVGAAQCTSNGTGSISDTVNIPAGLSITYTITANVSPYAAGALSNTASVNAPVGFIEIAPGDNSATDSDTSTTNEPDIGPPDGTWTNIPQGSSQVLILSQPIVADGDLGTPDFVYYERPVNPQRIELDWVQVEISSDGNTWYQVFYWGDPGGMPDTNTNVDVQNVIADLCPTEIDNCSIPMTRLYNSTGITIDVDALVPPGNYSWIRLTSPPSPDPSEVDAIQPYYP